MKILDLIYPQNIYCMCCDDCIDKSRIHGICDSCAEKIDWCVENRFKSAMKDFAFDNVLSCCIYGAYPRIIVYKMKMYSQPYIARNLGKLLAERVALSEKEDGIKYDFLVPVPSSKEKIRRRGFNQAQLLAKYASSESNIPMLNALIKTKETKASKTVGRLERHFVQSGAFAISEECKEVIAGKNILLVDDVITTGSTADECARILKSENSSNVCVLCFASTPHV